MSVSGIHHIQAPKDSIKINKSIDENDGNALVIYNFESKEAPISMASAYKTEKAQIKTSSIPVQQLKVIQVVNDRVFNQTTNQGVVAYKIPTEMKVRNTYQVLLRIAKSSVNIYENLNGEVRTSTLPITETMEVKLIDPSPADGKIFDIIPDNDYAQIVENGNTFTQWTWNVTPLKMGKAQLKIMISIVREGNKKETVYQDMVQIKLDIGKEITFFFGKYWQWLSTTLIIPFGIWLYKRHKKEKAEEEEFDNR
jgi:hypothetical protein